jgi:hypothetical protein
MGWVNGLVAPQEINLMLTGTGEGIDDAKEHSSRGKGGEEFDGDHVCV